MYNEIKNLELTTEVYNYITHTDSTYLINRLKDNAYRDPKIKIHNVLDTFYGSRMTNLGIFTYMVVQALSKILPDKIKMSYHSIAGAEYISELHNRILFPNESDDYITFKYVSIAESNFYKNKTTNELSEYGFFNKDLNREINHTFNSLYGIAVSKDKRKIIIFRNPGERFAVQDQIFSLLIAYKTLNKVRDEKVDTLFLELNNYYKTKIINDSTLKEIILKYAKDLPEYIIDKSAEFERLIHKLNQRRLSNYEAAVSSARSHLNRVLEQLAQAQKDFDDCNKAYAGMVYVTNNDNSLKMTIDETLALFERSKCITDYGLSNTKLYFTIFCPLKINNKEEWERISNNIFQDPIQRTLINQTLIDELYELYTECTVYIDLDTRDVSRYTNCDKVYSPNAIPHPHISGYSCFGQHSNVIGKCIAKGDYITAVVQAIEAASGINWADAPVTNKFSNYLRNTFKEQKCFKNTATDEWFSLQNYIERNTNASTETNQANTSD